MKCISGIYFLVQNTKFHTLNPDWEKAGMNRTRWPPQRFPTLSFYDCMILSHSRKVVHKNWVFLLGEEGVLGGARGGPAPISPPWLCLQALAGWSRIEFDMSQWFFKSHCSFLFPWHWHQLWIQLYSGFQNRRPDLILGVFWGQMVKNKHFLPSLPCELLRGKLLVKWIKLWQKKTHGRQQQTQALPCTGSEEKCWIEVLPAWVLIPTPLSTLSTTLSNRVYSHYFTYGSEMGELCLRSPMGVVKIWDGNECVSLGS